MGILKDAFVLDACALIAVFAGEQGGEKVDNIIQKANRKEIILKINQINLLEVYYTLLNNYGQDRANNALEKVKRCRIATIIGLTDQIFKEAGRLKAIYKIPFGDSVAAAECLIRKATLITSDRSDFEKVGKGEPLKIEWFR